MNLLSEHEAFLRAIFDNPDDDTPRLVYADYLEENGDPLRAEFIRIGCEQQRLRKDLTIPRERVWSLINRQLEIQSKLAWERPDAFSLYHVYDRGFPLHEDSLTTAQISTDDLENVESLRMRAIFTNQQMFRTTTALFQRTNKFTSATFATFFRLAVFAKVATLDFRGRQMLHEQERPELFESGYIVHPTITNAEIAALLEQRGLKRITALDLRNNDLDNDAALALVKSPYLDNLKRLDLLEGNRLRGRVWQKLIERFGEQVVG